MEEHTPAVKAPASAQGAVQGQTLAGRHVLQWHITHRCNLRCKHCYQDDYRTETNREELLAILDKYERFLKERSLSGHINLTGGEPLASPYFYELAEEITRRGITFSVQVSLDGGPDVHDAIRGAGASAAAYRGIDWMKEFGVHVLVSFTAQRTNRFELAEVARVARKHRVDKVWWHRVIIPREEETAHLMLTPQQFRLLAWRSGRLTRKTRREDGTSLVTSVRGLQFLYCPDTGTYTCQAGRNLLIIKANGDMMPCRRLPDIIGNVRDGEIGEIIDASPVMKALREAGIPEACGGCPHAQKCRGGSRCVTRAKTGSSFGKDPDCWMKGGKNL